MTDVKVALEPSIAYFLQRVGIRRGQTILDFGCGYGMYTIPVARIASEPGKIYALDKDTEALRSLTYKARSEGLRNVETIETAGELEIELTDESVDGVLLFEVFHSFYFPRVEDRRKLLYEIHRIMRPTAFLSISFWPNLLEAEAENEIENADFRREKEVFETPADNKDFHTYRALVYRKA